jgi:DNA primase
VIPSSFIQDLLARTDVVDIVGRHVTLKKAGINYKGLCPFHGEKSPSFIVSPSRQTYHCFGCGVHGNALGFLMEHAGLNFVEAVRDLAQIQGMPVPEEQSSPQEQERARQQKAVQVSLTDVLGKAAQHWKAQLKASPRAVQYLKGRGLTGEIAARFALGYAPEGWKGLASAFAQYDDPLLVEAGLVIVPDEPGVGADAAPRRYDRFRDRIMFPIRSVKGDIIGFGGRVLDKGEPKYLNSPETPVFSKGRELYGLYEARTALRNKGYCLVTEGYMDVVALAQWGFGNAVATLGTACTADHMAKLFRFTEQVVFSFDGDAAGRRAAGRALEAALPHATDTRRVSFLFLPANHDPDSFIREQGAEAFEACVQAAVPLSRQILEHAAHDCDLGSAEGRVKLLAQAVPLLKQLPEGGLRSQIAMDLADKARCPYEEVRARLDAEAPGPSGATGRGGRGGREAGDRQAPGGAPRPRRQPAAPGSHGAHDQGMPSDADIASAMADIDEANWAHMSDPGEGWSVPDQGQGYGSHGDGGGQGGWSGRSQRQDGERYQGGQGSQRGGGGGKGQGRGGPGSWKGRRDAGGWDRAARPAARPLPQAARPLERAAWLLLHRSDLWEQLPTEMQQLLCEQDMPLGAFFSWLDRVLMDEGPMSALALLERLSADANSTEGLVGDTALISLAQRLGGLHEVTVSEQSAEDIINLVQPLQLRALNDELELLLQSGELSDQAEARKLELITLSTHLKLTISRKRPLVQ